MIWLGFVVENCRKIIYNDKNDCFGAVSPCQIGAIAIKKGKFEQPRVDSQESNPRLSCEDVTIQIPIPPQAESAASPSPEPEQAAGSKRGLMAAVAAGAAVLVILTAMFIWGMVLKGGDTIYPNVYVAGIPVGGMDRAAATAAVDEAVTNAYSAAVLHVKLQDQTLSFYPEQTRGALNTEQAVSAALSCGRKGNPFLAVTNYWMAAKQRKDVDLQPIDTLDTAYIRAVIDQVAEEAALEPSDAQVDFNPRTKTISVVTGSPDRALNADGLYQAVYEAFANDDFSDLHWDYEEVPCEPVDLTPYYEKYCTAPVDAVFDEETGNISEEAAGFGFDPAEVALQLAAAEPGSQIVIPLKDMEPKVTKQELEKQYFGVELFSKSTAYVVNENRTNNLRLACKAINGTVLMPGEVFSFNETVGERTAEKGYLPATVYSGGESLPELGGGVCQVASTMYYVTLHMDLEQVERTEHMFNVTYVPMGMDATIYWGSLDYKFKNTLDYPIKIQANLDGDTCNITFWGEKPLEKKVEMSYSVLFTDPWEEVEELDETKPIGFREEKAIPYTGYKVVTYKTVYGPDGSKLSSGVEAYSTYERRDHVFIVGPSENPDLPVPDDPLNPDVDWEQDDLLPPEWENVDDPLNPWN